MGEVMDVDPEDDDLEEHDDRGYQASSEVDPGALPAALRSLELFDDPYLSMQATNLGMIDMFCMGLEDDLLATYWATDRTPVMDATFVSAQSQMWIFAAYELLRTWRQRAKDAIKWGENGGLPAKIADLSKELGFLHAGRLMRAAQLERLLAEPARLDKLREDLRRIHIPYERMHFLRIALAKHEVSGRKNAIAHAPGYGRINMWSGAIDFELSNGRYILGNINRRDIANEIRAIALSPTPPTPEHLAEFDAFMKGPADEPSEAPRASAP
jgi:hypothetical protein